MQRMNLIAVLFLCLAFTSTGFSMEDDSSSSRAIVPYTESLQPMFLDSSYLIENLSDVITQILSKNNIKIESPQEKLAWWFTFEAFVYGVHMSAIQFAEKKCGNELKDSEKTVLMSIAQEHLSCHSCKDIVFDALARSLLDENNPLARNFVAWGWKNDGPKYGTGWLQAPVMSRSCPSCIKKNHLEDALVVNMKLPNFFSYTLLAPWINASLSAWERSWDQLSLIADAKNNEDSLKHVPFFAEVLQLHVLARDINEYLIPMYQTLLETLKKTTNDKEARIMTDNYSLKLDDSRAEFLTPWLPRAFPGAGGAVVAKLFIKPTWLKAREFFAGEMEELSENSILPYVPHDVVLLILHTYFEVVRDSLEH